MPYLDLFERLQIQRLYQATHHGDYPELAAADPRELGVDHNTFPTISLGTLTLPILEEEGPSHTDLL